MSTGFHKAILELIKCLSWISTWCGRPSQSYAHIKSMKTNLRNISDFFRRMRSDFGEANVRSATGHSQSSSAAAESSRAEQ